MGYEYEDNKETSKYNEAWLAIERLDESWRTIKRLFREGKLDEVKYELNLIWLELSADVLVIINDDELEEENKTHLDNISKAKTKQTLYNSLMERAMFLKVVQHKAGKGGKYQDGSQDDFE